MNLLSSAKLAITGHGLIALLLLQTPVALLYYVLQSETCHYERDPDCSSIQNHEITSDYVKNASKRPRFYRIQCLHCTRNISSDVCVAEHGIHGTAITLRFQFSAKSVSRCKCGQRSHQHEVVSA